MDVKKTPIHFAFLSHERKIGSLGQSPRGQAGDEKALTTKSSTREQPELLEDLRPQPGSFLVSR